MVDWKSPAETAKYALAFDRFVHALLGLYAWECFISFDFDWDFIRGRKRFRWPMIFYFLNRYFMLFALIGVVIGLDVTQEINCKALYIFNTITGASAIGLASINLSLRAMAVWSRKWYIVAPLTLIIIGQFVLLMHVLTLNATWIDGKGCVISFTDNPMLMAAFIYTMIFDMIILTLMSVRLFKTTSGTHSRLRMLIFNDGLIFFIVAFLSNAVATTFISLKLNPIMSVIANLPATILSTIVACRVVRRLNNYSSGGPEAFPTAQANSGFRGVRPNVSTSTPKDGIHVQMETFQTPDHGLGLDAKATIVKFASGDQMGKDMYDPESQVIHGDFNGPPRMLPSP